MELFKTALVDHWLGLGAFTALDPGLVPGWATKILQASQCGPKKKKSKNEIFQREILNGNSDHSGGQCSAIL